MARNTGAGAIASLNSRVAPHLEFANLAHLGVVCGPRAVPIVSRFRFGVNSGAAPAPMYDAEVVC